MMTPEQEALRARRTKPSQADLELKVLVWSDTLMALMALAGIELKRAVSTVPLWLTLSLARLPLWLLLWLSASALGSYWAYALSGSVALGLTALVLIQAVACLCLELMLRALRRRCEFAATRRAWRDYVTAMTPAPAAANVSPPSHERH